MQVLAVVTVAEHLKQLRIRDFAICFYSTKMFLRSIKKRFNLPI
jgi:hypothetical protein